MIRLLIADDHPVVRGGLRALLTTIDGFEVVGEATDGEAAIFYFHPWEIDPGQPRVAGAPLKSRLRHYSRHSAMRPKLLRLFKAHSWGRTDMVVERERGRLS